MTTRTALITGATSGIGKASSAALAGKGFNLIITGRSEDKGKTIADSLSKRFRVKAEFIKADLSSIRDVRSFCECVKSKYDSIDVLINNAGARFQKFHKSADGFELTTATNYLGHFVLTISLLGLLKKAPSARIINVSSGAHWLAVDIKNIFNPVNFDRRIAYRQSKLAAVLFSYELSRRLQGTNITVNAMDPGGVATNLGRNDGLIPWARHYAAYILKRSLVSPSTAAKALEYLSTSEELKNISGKYFFREKMTGSSELSYNDKISEELWDLSMKITGLDFNTD